MKSWLRAGLAGFAILWASMVVARADAVDDCNGDDPAKAIAGCTIVLAKPDQSKDNLEAAYVARGIAYENTKEYDKALADLDKAIKLSPKDANAYYNRGVVNESKADPDAALKDYNKSIELSPKEAGAYTARGNVNYNIEDLEAALKDYQKALSLDPKDAEALYGRGLTYETMDKKDLAIADFKRVTAISQDEELVGNATTELEKLQKK